MSDGRGTDGERRRWQEEDWAYEEGGEGSGRGEERRGMEEEREWKNEGGGSLRKEREQGD